MLSYNKAVYSRGVGHRVTACLSILCMCCITKVYLLVLSHNKAVYSCDVRHCVTGYLSILCMCCITKVHNRHWHFLKYTGKNENVLSIVTTSGKFNQKRLRILSA